MEQHKNPTQKWILLLVVIIVLGGLVAFLISRRAEIPDADDVARETATPQTANAPSVSTPVTSGTSPSVPSAQETPSVISEPVAQQTGYKDGNYQAVGNYVSPGGAESIGVSLDVKEQRVTGVSFEVKAKNPTSKNWQERFASNATSFIVGKKLDELNLTVVSGSSLTPVGFMDAVAKIKVQAKA